jgi:hypothetical protein
MVRPEWVAASDWTEIDRQARLAAVSRREPQEGDEDSRFGGRFPRRKPAGITPHSAMPLAKPGRSACIQPGAGAGFSDATYAAAVYAAADKVPRPNC